ncbi:hypothetical protein MKW98_024130 [Papaver atlanticum]|uniref:Cucumisin n=1 Tax=Papaver atlanticum TaxID=357466 RepID=A0AAD4T033_9MAGN|nr:hypothetical protein MKW98_024130 [Papaver atlanticum]
MAATSLLSNTFLIVFLAIASINLSCCAQDEDQKVYIVYMGDLPTESEYTPMSHHQNILQEILEGRSVQETLIHSYERSFNGFSAKLTEQEAQKLSGMKGIVSVFPNREFQLQTTRSWDFLGLTENVNRIPSVESNTIIGVIDSGIWPESASFSDDGLGPSPKKWKGTCNGGHNFTCNNKLIGARYYVTDESGEGSARDIKGHGTHTASTAAGNMVNGVSFFNVAKGNARGAVPSARIAAYKVCTTSSCPNDAILAGFDDANADGVDLISVSLGNFYPLAFEEDPIAIGSFHAMKNGILTSDSSGNSGPGPKTVVSNAPWLLNVAASSTDRRIIDKVFLGNGKAIQGLGVNGFNLNGTAFPLLYGDNVSTACDPLSAKRCSSGCLDKDLVEGKIVICDSARAVSEVFTSGALGTILISDSSLARPDASFVSPLPAALINNTSGDLVKSYFKSTQNPVATILPTESVKDSEAPVVIWFSSRGPNSISPDIVKPDISAPGVDILAAFSPVANPSGIPGDTRSVKYSILSGTSMACPHATGAAAYMKTFHADWSPSAIKSALMTTAFAMDIKATNPGLVYDTSADEYVQFLCGIGYDSTKVKLITNSSCPSSNGSTTDQPWNLNYPSFGAHVEAGKKVHVKFTRTVTNVGTMKSMYKVKITSDDRITVSVEPNVLSFKSLNEKKSFVVNVAGDGLGSDEMATASLVWSDEDHTVRSPIVVYSQSE